RVARHLGTSAPWIALAARSARKDNRAFESSTICPDPLALCHAWRKERAMIRRPLCCLLALSTASLLLLVAGRGDPAGGEKSPRKNDADDGQRTFNPEAKKSAGEYRTQWALIIG